MITIRIEDGQQWFNAGEVREHGDYHVVYFNKRPLWLLFRNTYYNEVMGMEFPNEHYKSKSSVPIYNIMKNRHKVGYFFPRQVTDSDIKYSNEFLFCPKTPQIKKNYYIWDLADNHTIKDHAFVSRKL